MPREISISLGRDILTGIMRGIDRSQLIDAIKEWERNTDNVSRYYKCVSIGVPGEWNVIVKKRCIMESANA